MKLFLASILCLASPLLCAAASENQFQELADELFAIGNIDKAFRTYGDAIRYDRPEERNFSLYLSAGDCAFLLDYKQIAFSYYCIATQKGAPAHLLVEHIRKTFCDGDIDCTGNTVKQIIAKNPEAADSLSASIADLLYKKSRFEEAAPLFASILLSAPLNTDLKSKLANALLHCNNADGARTLYQEIVEADPDNIEACLFLGNYHYLAAKALCHDTEQSRPPDGKQTDATEHFINAGLFLERVYSTQQSEVVREKLIEIFSATKNKEKANLYK